MIAHDIAMMLAKYDPTIKVVPFNPSNAVFEECVKMNCFYCKRYGNNWRCPPHLPDIDYRRMFSEYPYGALVLLSRKYDDGQSFEEARTESSVDLHRALLKSEKLLYEMGMTTAISFTGGSCKLCKDGCGAEGCNNPGASRSPLEAVGVNVVKTAANHGIDVRFPPDGEITRIGLVMWQGIGRKQSK